MTRPVVPCDVCGRAIEPAGLPPHRAACVRRGGLTSICEHPGCDQPGCTRGLCGRHYQQRRRAGTIGAGDSSAPRVRCAPELVPARDLRPGDQLAIGTDPRAALTVDDVALADSGGVLLTIAGHERPMRVAATTRFTRVGRTA